MTVSLEDKYVKSLRDVYYSLVEKRFFSEKKPRKFIEEALSRIEKPLKQGYVVLVRAPPGYGKTAISIAASVYAILNEEREFLQVVHVVPTRSLVEDIYKRVSDGIERLCVKSDDFVSRQYGLVHEAPYLAGIFVVSTLDTYFYNLIKLPLAEMNKISSRRSLGHYEVPRSSIFSSLNFLDEIHMFLEESSDGASTIISLIKALHELRVPLILSTATLPDKLIDDLREVLVDRLKLVDYLGHRYSNEDDFYSREVSKTFEILDVRNSPRNGLVRFDCPETLPRFIAEVVERVHDGNSRACGKALAVITNTIHLAKKIFRELKNRNLQPVLLHSRFTHDDKIKKLDHIRNSSKVVVVTTQVIEVGVDLSFDVMISELATPSSLIQRFGRLARGDRMSGCWLIYYTENTINNGSGVYNPKFVRKAKDYLTDKKVHWHLPKVDHKGETGYLEFINECWNAVEFDSLGGDLLVEDIITKSYISSENVKNVLLLGSPLRDENLCTIYLYEEEFNIPKSIEDLISGLCSSALTLPCGVASEVARKALRRHRLRVISICREGKGEIVVKEASKEDVLSLGDIKQVLGSTKIIAIPRELYEGGVHGEGLKEP